MIIILFLAVGFIQNSRGYEEVYPLLETENGVYFDEFVDPENYEIEKRSHEPFFEKTHLNFEDYEDPRPTRGGKTLRNDYFIRFGRSKHQDFLRFGRSIPQKRLKLVPRQRNKREARFEEPTPKLMNNLYNYDNKRSKQNYLRFGRNQHFLRFGKSGKNFSSLSEMDRLKFEDEEEAVLSKLREISESPIVRYLISVNADKCKN